MRPRTLLAALWILLSGCGSKLSYPPPVQRAAVDHRISAIIDLTDGRPDQAWGSIVAGVLSATPGANWRWVDPHSEFRFRIDPSLKWNLSVRLTATTAVLGQTGPQQATFRINGETTGAATLCCDGPYEFEFPLDPRLLAKDSPQVLTMDFKPCLARGPNPPLCVLLHSAGFVERRS
jgi:hypothetical protein